MSVRLSKASLVNEFGSFINCVYQSINSKAREWDESLKEEVGGSKYTCPLQIYRGRVFRLPNG